jgi:hypothetical protein
VHRRSKATRAKGCGGIRIGESSLERHLELLSGGVADRLTKVVSELCGTVSECGDHLVPLLGQPAQLVPSQGSLGSTHLLAQAEQVVQIIWAFTDQQVGQPGCDRRPPQPLDGPREFSVSSASGFSGTRIAGGGEVVRRKAVQLGGDTFEVHTYILVGFGGVRFTLEVFAPRCLLRRAMAVSLSRPRNNRGGEGGSVRRTESEPCVQ